MTEEERDDILDLLPRRFTLWSDEQEIPGWAEGRDYAWWSEQLGHPKAHPGCCATCGCAITCMLGAFYHAVVDSLMRELDRVGALRPPAAPDMPENTTDDREREG